MGVDGGKHMPKHEVVFDMIDTPRAHASRERLATIARIAGVRIPHLSNNKLFSYAAEKKHTGAMIAIMAPKNVVSALEKAGIVDQETESSDGLHLTLLYLGKAKDISKKTMEAICRAAEKVCAKHKPLSIQISGTGIFTPGEDGTPMYVIPNAKGLSALQADLENVIGNLVDLPSEHGWVPHMTVGYCIDKPEIPDMSKFPGWTAGKIRIQAAGKKVMDIPLGGFKRRAALDRLPISIDPAMWTDEQITEVLSTPLLLQRLREDQDLFIKVLEQAKKRNITPQPRDIGNWLEKGWFILWTGHVPLGFFRNKHQAELSRQLLIDAFATGRKGVAGLPNWETYFQDLIREQVIHKAFPGTHLLHEKARGKAARQIVDDALSEEEHLINHPLYEKKRRKFGNDIIEVTKAPEGTKPFPDAVVKGNRPTNSTVVASKRTVEKNSELDTQVDERMQQFEEKCDEFISDAVKKIYKRFKMGNPDPDKMANDGQGSMDILPIHADPVLWTDEQLLEAVNTPQLRKMLEERKLFQAVLEQIKKRGIYRGLDISQVKEWNMPDTGWFLVYFGLIPVGFAKGESAATSVMRSMLDRIERGEVMLFDPADFEEAIHKETRRLLKEQGERGLSGTAVEHYAYAAGMDFEKVAREFLTHPFYGKRRREFAKKMAKMINAPAGFEPPPETRISGARPIEKNEQATREFVGDWMAEHNPYYDPDVGDVVGDSDTFSDAIRKAVDESRQAVKEQARDVAAPIAKKIKWVREHYKKHETWPKDSEMADDIMFADAALNRILRAAMAMDEVGDTEGIEILSRQLDLYAERSLKRVHMASSKKAPTFWKSNMDYAGSDRSPWRGSVSEFKKKFKSLADFIKWRKRARKKRDRMYRLELLSASIRKKAVAEAMKDVHTLLTAFNCIDMVRYGHYVPEGGDDVSKLGDKEPKLWSDNPKFKTIEDFLNAYKKHHGNDADDEQLALDAAREMVRYWSLLLRKPKESGKRKK